MTPRAEPPAWVAAAVIVLLAVLGGAAGLWAGRAWLMGGGSSSPESTSYAPALERADSTDENGGAALALDPTIEPTAQPRSYVVEATVVGADDQTVTATRLSGWTGLSYTFGVL